MVTIVSARHWLCDLTDAALASGGHLVEIHWACAQPWSVWSQGDSEQVATEVEEKLNLEDEEKQAEATEEDAGRAAPPASSSPEPTPAAEESHSPVGVPQEEHHEEAKEEDVGDSRQHLNVVFIGHVGTDLVAGPSPPVVLVSRDQSAFAVPCTCGPDHDECSSKTSTSMRSGIPCAVLEERRRCSLHL